MIQLADDLRGDWRGDLRLPAYAQGESIPMRYVIAAVIVALFLIWDGLANDSHYTAYGVRLITHAFKAIGIS
jgi:hypothetical protein